ncbi:aldo/keto reductase [Saccharibacillus sp. O23]|uniref:aldo/keto reductase n=1 Tax=Saccharibacillus sp. O23 TaxID=2009338 RepID=UPI000B4E236D|nr:aldo/keto reductase [Saccharibacillus sp. O23]OWR31904.1 aldo/keto reductase [Saccharibacillus sp. O23]
MKFNRLGSSGLQVSELGLGTNAFGKRTGEADSIRLIHAALDGGINFVDTANIYAGTESERIIGRALEGRRSEVVLATKAGLPYEGTRGQGSSRRQLQLELESSLKRLKTDHVDLYQIHTFDPYTPLEETLRTLDDFVTSGKVRYIGASNYAAWELMKALGISERAGFVRYTSSQTCYSLADRTPENELIPMLLDQGLGLIPYFPLAGGILSGKYGGADSSPTGSRAETDPNFRRFLNERYLELGRQVSRLAAEAGTTPSVLSIAWLLGRPSVSTVIAGATSAQQVAANLESVDFRPDEALLRKLDEISEPFRSGDPFAVYRLK